MPLCIITSTGKIICYESPTLRKRVADGQWQTEQPLSPKAPVPTSHQAVIDKVADLLKEGEVDPTQQFAIFHSP